MDEDDESTPAKDQPVTDGMEIRVDRVDYQLRTEKETIAFKKLTEKSVSMYTDQRKVVQKGENGEKRSHLQGSLCQRQACENHG